MWTRRKRSPFVAFDLARLVVAAAVAAVVCCLDSAAAQGDVGGGGVSSASGVSRLSFMTSEDEALQFLADRRTQRRQAAQQESTNGADKAEAQEVLERDAAFAMTRGWWRVARQLILDSHEFSVDLASTVRRVATQIRNHLHEVEHVLNKHHDSIAVMSPAFQWAESPAQVFLNIKFAYRWSSPGALSVEDSAFDSTERSFSFSGYAQHSGVKRKYQLSLNLYKEIDPAERITNMNVWLDMKEKYGCVSIVERDELRDFAAGNYTASIEESLKNDKEEL